MSAYADARRASWAAASSRGGRRRRLRARRARVLAAIPPFDGAVADLAGARRHPRRAAGVSRSVARREAAGWGAVVVGVIGIGLGILATRSSASNLDQVFTASLIASMLVFATPLTFAAHRRHVLRALRRREHRPRGDDADGRLLGHLGRRQDGELGRRARDRVARRRPARARARVLRDPPAGRPDRRRHGGQLPRARDHRLLLRPALPRRERSRPGCRRSRT